MRLRLHIEKDVLEVDDFMRSVIKRLESSRTLIDDEIETLKEKLKEAEEGGDASEEHERQIQEQSDRIEELQAELQSQSRQKDEELEAEYL